MADIICEWLNSELCLSTAVDPDSLSRDFANGFLIGEILNRFQLQQDFQLFSKNNTANAKLNNFSRMEPTLQLLGVPFDLTVTKAVMQGRQGAAANLLYQLYIVLQKKKRSGLTATAMEIMKPAATARLHRVEKHIYTERLKTVVRRETDIKMQKIAKRFHKRGQDAYHQSIVTELQQEKERIRRQEERRMRDIEKHRQARRRQQEMMIQIKSAVVQIPKPPQSRSFRSLEKRQQLHKQQEAQHVHRDIAQFERNQKSGALHHTDHVNADEREQWNREYMENIRLRLEEDLTARQQRELRRRRALMEQLKAHEAQQEMIREEQMVNRLMRQTQQEKRITVQLMQIKEQKEVLRQNRIFQERQYQERRLCDFQEALDREAVLARQESLERSEEIRTKRELHKRLVTVRAQARYRKHFDICKGILGQIIDLATKAGEYRLLTDNLIPRKLMQEWMEMFLTGKPLYEVASVEPVPAEPTAEQMIELQKLQMLNNRDYQEYVGMVGEWVWSEAGENQSPLNNDILDHVVKRMKNTIKIPVSITRPPPPVFPRFTIRSCVLGKTHTGKTSCLTRITNVMGLHVLSVNTLIQDVLTAYEHEKHQLTSQTEDHQRDEQLNSGAECDRSGPEDQENTEEVKWSLLSAQHGSVVEKILMTGEALPDQFLVDIVVDAIRRNVPADSGWVLDGFPVNVSQAVMLENALTGSQHDETPEDSSRPALDLVVLLDVSDEQVLERAVRDQDRDEQKNLDDPAVLERDQIQHRISGFHDTWPKLEKWFGGKQNILVKVPAETDEDLLLKNVETIIRDTMESVERGTSVNHLSSCEDARVGSDESSSIGPSSAERLYVDEKLDQEISEYLVPLWENTCTSYEMNVKMIMQNLRAERELIIHHLYDIREDFRQHLLKPDLKQEFLSSWQSDYNSVSHDIRDDEETKSELHQRLDDLRERLWDICDKRRDEAVQERAAVINDGGLDDHTALLINHYSALMQTEVMRFQDCVYLLRDYYSGMSKSLSCHSSCNISHVPLLDVSWTEHMEPQTSNISSGSGPAEKQAKTDGKKETEADDDDTSKLFPLITSRSSPKEISKQDLFHPDEKLLQWIYQTSISAITNMVSAEVHQREEDDGDEEQQQMETQRTHGQSQSSDSAKRKAAKQTAAPPPSHDSSLPPAREENPEEAKRRKIRHEFTAALKQEEDAVKMRLELLKTHAVKTLCDLQQKTQQIYTNMQEWLETRFLSEMNSIDQLTAVVRQHIENGLQIHHELVLYCCDFCVDGDTRVIASAPPTLAPPLPERHRDGRLAVRQLNIICSQLHETAPSGVLSRNELMEVLQEVISPHMSSDVLPEPWTHLTSSQIVELVCVFSRDSEMLDWREFLLSAALPWPFASLSQLLKTLQRYRTVDNAGTGLITQEQYTQVELWFTGEKTHLVPDDPSEPDNLKKFFFSLFASTHSSPVMLDYMNMLLYFCCHPEASQGFIRALSLVTEHTLHYKHTGPLVQSVAHMEGAEDEEFNADEEDGGGAESDDVMGVSVDDVLRVLSHRENLTSAHVNRFHSSSMSRDEYREELIKVWKELSFKAEEKIPFSVLSQHPYLQDLIEASSQYLLVDIHKILQNQKTEEDCKSYS